MWAACARNRFNQPIMPKSATNPATTAQRTCSISTCPCLTESVMSRLELAVAMRDCRDANEIIGFSQLTGTVQIG